jgi:maltose O-acetyltransferase
MQSKVHVMITWIWMDIRYAVWHFFINFLASSVATPRPLRYIYYRLFKMDIRTPSIQPSIFFRGPAVKIGRRSFINTGCFFENGLAPVEIGSMCEVAMEVMFCTATHKIGTEQCRSGAPVGLPIKVEDGCWIGTRATILPGVVIKRGCVIAAGAVVTRDCEPNGLYAGVPAQRIKDLP